MRKDTGRITAFCLLPDPIKQSPPEPLGWDFDKPVHPLGCQDSDEQRDDESHSGRARIAGQVFAGHVGDEFDADGVDDDGLEEEIACDKVSNRYIQTKFGDRKIRILNDLLPNKTRNLLRKMDCSMLDVSRISEMPRMTR